MSSAKIIKRRIRSSKNIAQITKAMEMVSASKMRRAQEMALSSRPYAQKMVEIITALAAKTKDQIEHFLLKDPRAHWPVELPFNILIVLLSTDKSFCGGLNTNLFRGLELWLKDLKTHYQLPVNPKLTFITIGRKAKEHILKSNRLLLAEFGQFGDRPKFSDIVPVAKMIMEGFRKNEFQMAFVVYMEFISTISQKIKAEQLLPIRAEEITGLEKSPTGYLFEPQPAEIFAVLLPQYIELRLYHTLVESVASEHSARMVAMKNANENALEIVSDLTLEYNQVRQARITNELLDVVSARMALE
ncbi:MAG: ATP synthase F1 subunit gamma [Candidatus Beckwithbacteria bacterium]|nr:ATP synthase F1 subunit gamma [Candidatus Beckwithbacteria bacterium]